MTRFYSSPVLHGDHLRFTSGSLAVGDHLRSILGIICGLGIIFGRGSFAALCRLRNTGHFSPSIIACNQLVLAVFAVGFKYSAVMKFLICSSSYIVPGGSIYEIYLQFSTN